ncbi:hypothetical protein FYJ24_11250 [Actinomycetaceae bacterium WB03_NA08]|uniref:Recombinase zinc beta ribbon domain-containing protein n=1 Tax=Scrofimicrobium canadense TaxID=2652290 RepID=A0A6N7VU64_9ACTO|nr:hypothetical protein [Scrofimicrobium canadense]
MRCGQCGGWFGRKTWHSTSKYARHIWRCNNKYESNKTRCVTPRVLETQIEEAFVAALAERMSQTSTTSEVLEDLDATVFNTEKLHAELAVLDEQAEGLVARMNNLARAGAKTAIDPDRYEANYESLETKYETIDAKRLQVEERIRDLEYRSRQAHQIHDCLQNQPPLAYTPEAWNTLVTEANVDADGTITICFKDEPSCWLPCTLSREGSGTSVCNLSVSGGVLAYGVITVRLSRSRTFASIVSRISRTSGWGLPDGSGISHSS